MRATILLGVLAGLTLLTGCATTTHSWDERKALYKVAMDHDMRQVADDWDSIWMLDRGSRLSRWNNR
ncbi:MAG: hypothetical protein KDA32_03380 [Phycisphaerales bacterium]|nr:hypothetical protein [Phycisphaerales bacterium]